ncbi:MAG: peptidyl-tRNA hydrolase Pth2 [Halobacteriaceae archaeon]
MKQAIVARADLGMGAGKLAAQVAHAALNAAEDAGPDTRREWRTAGQTKVVLKAEDEATVLSLAEAARRAGLPVAVVRDAGRTQLDPGTVTAVGIGPGPDEEIDRITGELSLY